jgi:hypothetical protein
MTKDDKSFTGPDRLEGRFIRLAVAALLLAAGLAGSARADVVTEWNATTTTISVAREKRAAAVAVVDAAYVHAAIYDAVNAIDRRFTPYAVVPSSSPPAGTSAEAAAASAAYHVLRSMFPGQQPVQDGQYAQSLAQVPDGKPKADGVALGAEIAAKFMALRGGDGWNAPVIFTPGSGAGAWQPTSGPPVAPWMAQMRPFALDSPSQFRAEGPPALGSAQWAEDFNETKRLGALNGSGRTPEQTEIGRFYTEHTGAQYARVFRDFAAQQGLGLADNARLFAMLYVAGADSLIAGMESKYHFAFWRPVTAIRAGDTDGNDATAGDPNWAPLAATPGHPEYPAAHGCLTAAWAETLRDFFGTKRVRITLTSAVTGTSRTFDNTDDLIREIIDARVFGGMHYRTSGVHGAVIGRKVARLVAARYFHPVN